MKTFACSSSLLVFFNNEVFELSIFHPPEVEMLMFARKTEFGALHWVHSGSSKQTRLLHVLKPKLRVLLDGFEQYFPQFGAVCRYVKLWINSQLLLFEIGDLAVELLVAAMLQRCYHSGQFI